MKKTYLTNHEKTIIKSSVKLLPSIKLQNAKTITEYRLNQINKQIAKFKKIGVL